MNNSRSVSYRLKRRSNSCPTCNSSTRASEGPRTRRGTASPNTWVDINKLCQCRIGVVTRPRSTSKPYGRPTNQARAPARSGAILAIRAAVATRKPTLTTSTTRSRLTTSNQTTALKTVRGTRTRRWLLMRGVIVGHQSIINRIQWVAARQQHKCMSTTNTPLIMAYKIRWTMKWYESARPTFMVDINQCSKRNIIDSIKYW